jgi:hypothetical protein
MKKITYFSGIMESLEQPLVSFEYLPTLEGIGIGYIEEDF